MANGMVSYARRKNYLRMLQLPQSNSIWPAEQIKWDSKLDIEKYVWTDKIFSSVVKDEVAPKSGAAFVFTPRQRSPYLHVNSHLIAEKFTCNVWNVETNEYCYRTSLTKANRERNHRVRFGWNESLTSSIDYWNQRDASFDCFIGTELLATNDDEAIKRITRIMKPEAKFVVLEPVDGIDEPSIRKRMDACGFKNISILDVTEDSKSAEVAFFSDHKLKVQPLNCMFVLVRASF